MLERDGAAREVLVPRSAIPQLASQRGRQVTLHTLEVIEGSQGSAYQTPRLIGFTSPHEKSFFLKFIGVKGMGVRKALKALIEPAGRVARWIQDGDVKAIAQLPGIGSRGASVMVAELRGKLDGFALSADAAASAGTVLNQAQKDALTVLVGWGDSRADAERYLTEAAEAEPGLSNPEDWVRAAYRVKSGALRAG